MKNYSLQVCTAQLSKMLFIGIALLLLGGCGKKPDSAASEKLEQPNDTLPATDENASAGEAIVRTQPAVEVGTPKVVEVVKVLLKHHADPAFRDADGDSAKDFATRNRHVDVVKLLPD